MKRNKVLTLNKKIALLLTLCFAVLATAQGYSVNRYCVTWNSASGNPSGSMPIGNGEVGAYWHDLWAKSYLKIETPDHTTGFRLTQAYVLQRWVEKPAISSEVKHKLIVKK